MARIYGHDEAHNFATGIFAVFGCISSFIIPDSKLIFVCPVILGVGLLVSMGAGSADDAFTWGVGPNMGIGVGKLIQHPPAI